MVTKELHEGTTRGHFAKNNTKKIKLDVGY
jgi:hypothetical protein